MTRIRTHRPLHTRHGTHCLCGVFCGSRRDSWDGHRDDVLILHPDADTSPRPVSLLEAAIRRAFEPVAERMNELFGQGQLHHVPPPLPRSRTEPMPDDPKVDAIALLSQPVVVDPKSLAMITRITDV